MALRIAGPPQDVEEPLVEEPIEEAPIEEEVALPVEESGALQPGGQVSPEVARYLPPDAICANCIHFLEPNTCEIVAGPIEPQGRCSLFTPDQMEELPLTEEPDNGIANLPPDTA